ncbi:MAG: phosphoribosylformylglycinamidine synthase subunit PurQ [Candidatus Omnitrophica bacterium]|nr:phosphoribosylformylglycinamidine synthase subunit PurQ [Candidatus Omnitrophota bacterium]
MKFGVVVFPGSNCDQDCVHVLKGVLQQPTVTLWHQETALRGCDAVVLPGGFSYGDYLRTGAIAHLAPIMGAIKAFARDGGLVIGICNGFQILLESGLLPGAMLRNTGLRFICREVTLRVERTDTPFTNRFELGQVVRMPIAHNEGRYTIDAKELKEIQRQVVFRYEGENPNGSVDAIAGITNKAGNVLGMMPHPERACEALLGSEDGRLVFESMLEAHANV